MLGIYGNLVRAHEALLFFPFAGAPAGQERRVDIENADILGTAGFIIRQSLELMKFLDFSRISRAICFHIKFKNRFGLRLFLQIHMLVFDRLMNLPLLSEDDRGG